MEALKIPFEQTSIDLILEVDPNSKAVIIIAHGAGAPMTHPFISALSDKLLQSGITVIRFNFPYISEEKKFPGNPRRNIEAWKCVLKWTINKFNQSIFLSGKSYGGRMASHLAAENFELAISGLIYFGFPLHAPGKPSIERANHLGSITKPQLFLQGTNDALAEIHLIREVVSALPLAKLIAFENADHSFKGKGKNQNEMIISLANEVLSWSTQKNLTQD